MQPSTAQNADVVVLGAGIAGLLIAGELATDHRVIVLEKRPSQPKEKYWLTDETSLNSNPELEDAVDRRYTSLDFISASYASFRATGRYLLWDTDKLVAFLCERLKRRGGEIRYSSHVYSYQQTKSSVTVLYNDTALKAALAIDCMGYQSPFAFSTGAVKINGYYLLYGSTFTLLHDIDPIGLHNLVMARNPTYVEAFPTSNRRVHLILIGTNLTPTPIRDLKEAYSFVLNQSPYKHAIDRSASNQKSFLGGIIPVGGLRRRNAGRIVFFGEAGQYNPAASATALTRLLRTYKGVAASLSRHLADNTVTAESLSALQPRPMTVLNRRVQLGLFRSIMGWTSLDFDDVIGGLNRGMHNTLVNDLLFGTLPSSPSAGLNLVSALVRNREYTLLRALIRGFAGI